MGKVTVFETTMTKTEKRLASAGILKAKVSFTDVSALWKMLGLAVSSGMRLTFQDMMILALKHYPDPQGRQQRRDLTYKVTALIERLYAMRAVALTDERFQAWFRYNPDLGYGEVHKALLWATAYTPLKHDKLHERMYFDADDLLRLAEKIDAVERAWEDT